MILTAGSLSLRRLHDADAPLLVRWLSDPRVLAYYEKAGFRRVKLLPQHEWHEGALRNRWLMESPAPGTRRVS